MAAIQEVRMVQQQHTLLLQALLYKQTVAADDSSVEVFDLPLKDLPAIQEAEILLRDKAKKKALVRLTVIACTIIFLGVHVYYKCCTKFVTTEEMLIVLRNIGFLTYQLE